MTRANLGQQAVERGREGGFVVMVDGRLELGIQPVQLGRGRVVDP